MRQNLSKQQPAAPGDGAICHSTPFNFSWRLHAADAAFRSFPMLQVLTSALCQKRMVQKPAVSNNRCSIEPDTHVFQLPISGSKDDKLFSWGYRDF